MGAMSEARGHLRPQDRFLLIALGTASFFDGYDSGIIGLALKQIRATFDLTPSRASALLGIVYVGALPAVVITRYADRLGRRRLLIVAVFGYMCASGCTAVAPTAATFIACQFVSHLFLYAEGALVWTMAAEELPAAARGFGFGLLAMNSALGTGFAAILYGGFLEPAGVSWRWMYALSIPPLVAVGFLRRKLPESRRFLAAQQRDDLRTPWYEVMRGPNFRAFALTMAVAYLIMLVQQASTFAIDFLQSDRGLSASAANLMLVGAGLPGVVIMVAAGGWSDRYGRRLVGCGFAFMSFIGTLGFFWLPGGVPVLLPCMTLSLVGQLGAWPVLQTFVSEMFPTRVRGQAGAWNTVFRVAGQSSSLLIAAVLLDSMSQSATATLLGFGPLAAVIIVAIFFPDTHGRELEEITGEPALIPFG